MPAFAPAVIAQEWAGLIDTMPDIIPVISPLPGVEGLIVATGFSGHGFGIGPGAGRSRRRYGLQRNAARRSLSVSYLPLFRRNKNPH
ncbi:FAD-dependent oxidoreductase [Brucella abortus]|uniref:FAD-dependent oxidoreductase n=1 Tax=Brucella abortus TaxID=235 RepID=UPI001F238F66|nr:FAD-dependent oxidoreductase [Brucella abortus]